MIYPKAKAEKIAKTLRKKKVDTRRRLEELKEKQDATKRQIY